MRGVYSKWCMPNFPICESVSLRKWDYRNGCSKNGWDAYTICIWNHREYRNRSVRNATRSWEPPITSALTAARISIRSRFQVPRFMKSAPIWEARFSRRWARYGDLNTSGNRTRQANGSDGAQLLLRLLPHFLWPSGWWSLPKISRPRSTREWTNCRGFNAVSSIYSPGIFRIYYKYSPIEGTLLALFEAGYIICTNNFFHIGKWCLQPWQWFFCLRQS